MAFGVTVADRISFGNMKCVILNVNDVQNDGSSTHKMGWNRVIAVKAVNNTDSSDTFKEAVGAQTVASHKDEVTFTSVTNDDDGLAWVWGY